MEQLQFWLNTLAQYESSIPSVTVDGVYGTGTANTVRAFQRKYGLTVDGVVGRDTWTELYDQFRSIQSDNGTPMPTPAPPCGRVQADRMCGWCSSGSRSRARCTRT